MTVLKAILAALGETMAPDGTMVKIRLRVTLDMLVTLVVTVLAVVLAVGYQVLGRWARRSDPSDWDAHTPAEPTPPSAPQPMRLGQVLDVGVRILRRRWSLMLILSVLFAGPGALLTAATGIRFTEVALSIFPDLEQATFDSGMTITQAELERALEALVPYLLASVIAGVLLSLGALAFSAAVADDYHGRQPSLGTVLRACLRRTPSALVFMLVTSVIVVVLLIAGLLTMSLATSILPTASVGAGGPGVFLALVAGVGLVVAIVYLTMRWAPAYPAMVEEGLGWRDALRRSWHLSGDNVWRIFIITLFAAIAVALASSVLSQLFAVLLADALAPALGLDELVARAVAVALGSLIMAPLPAVLTAVLYFDLRARRDVATPADPSAAGDR